MELERNNFVLYTDSNGKVKVEVSLKDETLWLTQKAMAELFGTAKSTISEHLKNIFETGELKRNATVRKIRTVQTEGKRQVARNIEFYNLDAIIAVGYRVNSKRATQLEDVMIMDDGERLEHKEVII